MSRVRVAVATMVSAYDRFMDAPIVVDLRRRGVGRQIMGALVGHARTHFSRVRLRTIRSDAARFYTTLGFEEVDEDPDATHIMHF